MFKRIESGATDCTIEVDGQAIHTQASAPLALALLAAGISTFRHTAVSGEPRAPLCLMGVCFDCLVDVDGQPNVQACMVRARDGMRVQLQHGAATVREVA